MAEQISTEDLAAAFGGSVRNVQTVKKSGKNRAVSLAVLIVGLIMLAVGVVFLVLGIKKASLLADGDFLVSVGEWRLAESETCAENECEDTVIWTFLEIGKGTLTTNGHKNDYDFKWAIRDGKLVIETDWLYELDNEYEYMLDQETRELILKDDDKEYRFVAEEQK